MTPDQYKVRDVAKLEPGHVAYFDDPNDSNPFGHIVTVMARLKGYPKSDLNGIIVRSNDVVTGEVAPVRASYFQLHWGDAFQFGSDWLNGYVFTDMVPPPPKPKLERVKHALANLKESRNILKRAMEHNQKVGNVRVTNALSRDIKRLDKTIARVQHQLDTLGR